MAVLDRLVLNPAPAQLPEGVRRAAVALLVTPDERLLFIRRAERKGDLWSGHVAFPGGREDPADGGLLQTAMREVREEIGLDLATARVLGTLPPQTSPRNAGPQHVNVIPFVFQLANDPELTLNDEVSEVGYVPLTTLITQDGRTEFMYTWQGAQYELPCFDLPFGRLWGMTLRMVDDLVELLGGGDSGMVWPPEVPTR